MYHYNNLMVALDLSYMDKTLVEYTSFICNLVKPEKIYFINIQRDLEIPEDILEEFSVLRQPRDEMLIDKLKATIEENFKNHEDFDIGYKIAEGGEVKEVLHWARIKLIDLLIIGRKDLINGSGHTAQVFSRKMMSSVLMVPENPEYDLKEIVVPIDFSEFSDMAVDKALEIARNQNDVTIFFIHIYQCPIGYYSTGKTLEEFSEIMRKNAEKEFDKYIKTKDLEGITYKMSYELDVESRPVLLIHKLAIDVEADLIILGAKGRTPATSVFLGSVAEKLIKMECDKPLLIVKSKEKSFDILDLLKSI